MVSFNSHPLAHTCTCTNIYSCSKKKRVLPVFQRILPVGRASMSFTSLENRYVEVNLGQSWFMVTKAGIGWLMPGYVLAMSQIVISYWDACWTTGAAVILTSFLTSRVFTSHLRKFSLGRSAPLSKVLTVRPTTLLPSRSSRSRNCRRKKMKLR
jgi:hypothetical protein